jgi:hypothetical protein
MTDKPKAKSAAEVPADEESTMVPKEERRQADADASAAEQAKRDKRDS